MSRQSAAMNDLKKLPHRAKQAAQDTLHGVENRLAQGYESFKSTAEHEVRAKPLGYVLAAFATGLLLGRFKVRPVETVFLACGTGLFLGLSCAPGHRAENKSNR